MTNPTTLPRPKSAPTPTDAMPHRTIRVDKPTWNAAAERAKREGLTLSQVIRHYLHEYAEGDQGEP